MLLGYDLLRVLKITFCSPGSVSDAACFDCPAGKYCQTAGSGTWTGDCCPGYFCPTGSSACEETICPIGSQVRLTRRSVWRRVISVCDVTWVFRGVASENLLILTSRKSIYNVTWTPRKTHQFSWRSSCSSQCPEGRGSAEECGAGFHAPREGMTACEVCPDGRQCHGGTNITNCEPGHYCSGGVKTPCPTGTFLDNVS